MSNCGVNNGHIEELGLFSIQQTNNTSITMIEQVATGGTCTYAGSYSQLGHMGDVVGNFACSNGNAGVSHVRDGEEPERDLRPVYSHLHARLPIVGHFGGILR